MHSAYFRFLHQDQGFVFVKKNQFIPNIEIKFVKNETDDYSFQNRIPLIIADRTFYISPHQIQIAHKLWPGSGKDIEDALFHQEISRDIIDKDLLREFCTSFGVSYDTTG